MKDEKGADGIEKALQVEETVQGGLDRLVWARRDLRRFSKA